MLKLLKFFCIMIFCIGLTSCQTNKYSVGKQEYTNGQYNKAVTDLKKAYRKTDPKNDKDLRGEIAWMLGNCYEKLMIPAMASANFQNALRYNYNDSTLLYHIGKSKLMEGKYKESVKFFDQYLEEHPNDSQAILARDGAAKSKEIKDNKSRYIVKKFSIIDSRRAEFSPAVWGTEDDELYFTTSNDKVTGTTVSSVTGTKFNDIWFTKKDEKGVWQKPTAVSSEINTEEDEGTPCFSPDGNTMFYTKISGNENGSSRPQIYYSKRSDATWSKGTLLKITNDTVSTYAHPAISADGKYLYFVSDIIGGQGGLDIWRASIEGTDVKYIENLGDQVNTKEDEMFPSISPDGILYYSSRGKGGIGGLDIYSAREDEWHYWHIEQLGAPINSNADDFGMTFCHATKAKQEGWFSSNRNSAKGYDKIYSFLLPSLVITISGTVYSDKEEPISGAIIRVVGRNGMNYKSVTKPDGTYSVDIDRSTEYVMMSGKTGYLNRKAQFTSDSAEDDADYVVDFILPSISEPVEVKNIFYDYNSAKLREESFEALDELVQILNDNPYTQIELASHTDRIGSQKFNLDLSQRRAEAVCDYLVSKGIDSDRLVPKGYGKSSPLISEEEIAGMSEEEQKAADQKNRRTEFKVLTTTFGIE